MFKWQTTRRNELMLLILNFIFLHLLPLGSLNWVKESLEAMDPNPLCLWCHELPVMATEDEGLLPPTMDPQTIYRRKADTSLLANFLYLFWTSHTLWPYFFISRQRGEYQTVLGEIKADLNSHCSPNHRDRTRSDHLAWSCYLWIQASKGCPEVYGSPMSLQQCCQTGNNRDGGI